MTIAGGDTVTWKNVDTVSHQVVANNGAFASRQIGPNRIYAKRIDTPGTYGYHDALHPTLKGTVKVTGAAPSISNGASTLIAVYGDSIHVTSHLAGRDRRHRLRLRAAVRQASFVKIADVQTTTNGVWDLITTRRSSPCTRRRGRARRAPSSRSLLSRGFDSHASATGSSHTPSPASTAGTGSTCNAPRVR